MSKARKIFNYLFTVPHDPVETPAVRRKRYIIRGLLIAGFAILVVSGALSVAMPGTPFAVVAACTGLSCHAIANKLIHDNIKERKAALRKEHAELTAKLAELGDPEALAELTQNKDTTPKEKHPLLSRIGAWGMQTLGMTSLIASAVMVFFPAIAFIHPIFLHIGWGTFMGGSALEQYNCSKTMEKLENSNKELKTRLIIRGLEKAMEIGREEGRQEGIDMATQKKSLNDRPGFVEQLFRERASKPPLLPPPATLPLQHRASLPLLPSQRSQPVATPG